MAGIFGPSLVAGAALAGLRGRHQVQTACSPRFESNLLPPPRELPGFRKSGTAAPTRGVLRSVDLANALLTTAAETWGQAWAVE